MTDQVSNPGISYPHRNGIPGNIISLTGTHWTPGSKVDVSIVLQSTTDIIRMGKEAVEVDSKGVWKVWIERAKDTPVYRSFGCTISASQCGDKKISAFKQCQFRFDA